MMASLQFIQSILGFILLVAPCLRAATTTGTPTSKVTVTLPETTAITSWHLSLNVTAGDNQEMTCSVTGDAKAQEYFTVIPRTCLLALAKSLDTDPAKSLKYDVFIKYYNESAPSDVSYISLTILVSRNQFGPVFNPAVHSARVSDYDPIGTSVMTISASDNDIFAPNNMIFYSLSNSSFQANEYFSVDSVSGRIIVNKRLSCDPTRATSYTLLPVAFDMSCTPRSATGTVMVTVSRNMAPKFTDKIYIGFVSELAKVLEETILIVSAVDSDLESTLNGQLTYSIKTPEANRKFEINSTTGAITPRVELRRVTTKNWLFEVVVSDAGVPPLSDVASVSIVIQMTGYPFFTPDEYDIAIPEDYVLNTTVVTVTAADPVSGSVLLYDLRGDGVSPSFFSVSRHTGQIVITTPLRTDSQKSTLYTLRVVAFRQTDIYSTAEAIVKVSVIRNRSGPVFSSQSLNALFIIPENQPVGVGFANISAVDNDTGESGVVVYSISPFGSVPSSTLSYFYINPHTGSLVVTSSLLSDPSTTQYILSIIATDQGAPSKSAFTRVTVRVTRNPHAPVFLQDPYTVTVPETVLTGHGVVNVTATDSDGDTVVYAILSEPPDSFFFTITQSTGQVNVARSFSQDVQERYSFRVTATDSGQSPKTGTVMVSVHVIRNPNTPVFSTHAPTVNVSEYTNLMYEVLTVSANDADDPQTLSGQIRYSITSQTPVTASGYFIISPTTGSVSLVRHLNNPRSPDSVMLSVTASDRFINPKTTTTQVTVNVIRNMHAPVFDNTNVTVNVTETVPVGEVIAVVNAIDADALEPFNRFTPNAEIKYRIVTSNDLGRRVLGVTDDGKVFIKEPLNMDREGNYTLTVVVRAEDSGWHQLYSDLSLTVKVIQQTTVTGTERMGFIQPLHILTLTESTKRGELITLNVANQQNNVVLCMFVDGNQDFPDQFSLTTDEDGKNCILVLRQLLDRETTDSYRLIVRVESSNSRVIRAASYIYNTWQETEIVLHVSDENDNAPRFLHTVSSLTDYAPDTYYTAISSSAKPLDVVTTRIKAVDVDGGWNGEIVYILNSTDQRSLPFLVSPKNGEIFTILEFTPLSSRQYRFHMTARDNPVNQKALHTQTEVIVNLIDEKNRFVLVLKNKSSDKIIPLSEDLRRIIQEEIGYLTLIEKIQARRSVSKQQSVNIDLGSTDVIFVLVGNEAGYRYRLVNNSEQNLTDRFTSDFIQARLKLRISSELNVQYDGIRLPYKPHVDTSTDTHVPSMDCFPKISGTGRCSYALQYFLSCLIIAHALTP